VSAAERDFRTGSDEVLLAELLAGRSLRAAAEKAGMSYATARRRRHEERFAADLAEAKAELREAAVGAFLPAALRAVARLEFLVDNAETESNQIAASRALLQHMPGVVTLMDMAERLEAVEAAQGLDPRSGWRAGKAAA
jgi:hypothetical protein